MLTVVVEVLVIVVVAVVRMMEGQHSERLGYTLAVDHNNLDFVVELHMQRLWKVLMPIRSLDMDFYQHYVCDEQ